MSKIALVQVTCGAGKTRRLLDWARGEGRDRATVVIVPTHALAREIQDRVGNGESGRPAERYFSIASAQDDSGTPLCRVSSSARRVQEAQLSVRATLCRTCCYSRDNGGDCQAQAGRDGSTSITSPLIIAPIGHAKRLIERIKGFADPLIVWDEPPSPVVSAGLSARHITEARGALSSEASLTPRYRKGVEFFLSLALRAIELLSSTDVVETPVALHRTLDQFLTDPAAISQLDDALESAGLPVWGRIAVDGHGRPEGVEAERRPLAARLQDLAATLNRPEIEKTTFRGGDRLDHVARIARVAPTAAAWISGAATARWSAEDARLDVVQWNPDVEAVLSEHGLHVILLDATPDSVAWERACAHFGHSLSVERLDAADRAPVKRIMLHSTNATRRALIQRIGTRWDRVGPQLVRALSRLAEWERVESIRVSWLLLVLFKPLHDALVELGGIEHIPHDGAREVFARWRIERRKIDLEYHGRLEGRDTWREADACLTLGDPFPNIDALDAESSLLGLGTEQRQERIRDRTAARLAQAHGRLRAPSREKPAILIHVGSVPPTGWNQQNATVESIGRGRLPAIRDDKAMRAEGVMNAVRALGGLRRLARATGLSSASLSRYSRGLRVVPSQAGDRIRAAVACGRDDTPQGTIAPETGDVPAIAYRPTERRPRSRTPHLIGDFGNTRSPSLTQASRGVSERLRAYCRAKRRGRHILCTILSAARRDASGR